MPVTRRMTTVQVVADKNRRSASELRRIARRCEEITQAAHRLNHVNAELLADAPYENFDRIGVAIEILVIEMLDQLAARDYAARMMHEVGKQAILMRRQFHWIAVNRHAPGAGIEPHRPAVELALGVASRAPQKRADTREHFLEMKGFCNIVIRARIEALNFVTPAVARREHEDGHR